MKPTSPNPTGNALSGLKEEAARVLVAPVELGHGDIAPPRLHRMTPDQVLLADDVRSRLEDMAYGAARAAAVAAWIRGSWRGLGRYLGVRAAVHTSRGSFFLRRLEVRP